MLRKIFVFVLCFVIGLAFAANASVITYRDEADWTEATVEAQGYWFTGLENKKWLSLWDFDINIGMAVSINYAHDWWTLEAKDGLPTPDIDVTVKVRELPDGSAMVTVTEIGTNAPAIVFQGDYEFEPFYPIIGEPGMTEGGTIQTDMLVDYVNIVKFPIPSPDAPFRGYVDMMIDDSLKSWHITIFGKGTLSPSAEVFGYTPGNTAEIIVNQLSVTGGALKSGQYPGLDAWPVEHIIFRQIEN
jgi:hypothetical protein